MKISSKDIKGAESMVSNSINPKFNHCQTGFVFSAIAAVLFLFSGCDSEEEDSDETIPSEDESENVIPENGEEDDETDQDNEIAEDEPDVTVVYGVSAGHPDAVKAGMEVLENGGNAADAAIAAAFAVSVVEPFASGIGGGGVTLIQEQGEEPEAYDYREVVPEAGIPASDTDRK